jgi:hypothetical protein
MQGVLLRRMHVPPHEPASREARIILSYARTQAIRLGLRPRTKTQAAQIAIRLLDWSAQNRHFARIRR